MLLAPGVLVPLNLFLGALLEAPMSVKLLAKATGQHDAFVGHAPEEAAEHAVRAKEEGRVEKHAGLVCCVEDKDALRGKGGRRGRVRVERVTRGRGARNGSARRAQCRRAGGSRW